MRIERRPTNWWVFWLVRAPMMIGSAALLCAAFGQEFRWKHAAIATLVLLIIELAWPSRARRSRPAPRPPVELAPGQIHIVVAVAPPPSWWFRDDPAILGELVTSAPVGQLHLGFCEDHLVVLDDGRADSVLLEIADWRSKVIHGGTLGMVVRQR